MGYKMPIVCKEIYLPVEPSFLANEPTIKEYNEHYGLDLLSILNVVYSAENNNVRFIEPEYTKINLVLTGYGVDSSLSCIRMANSSLIKEAESNTFMVGYYFAEPTQSDFGFGLNFHFVNGELDHLSLFEI